MASSARLFTKVDSQEGTLRTVTHETPTAELNLFDVEDLVSDFTFEEIVFSISDTASSLGVLDDLVSITQQRILHKLCCVFSYRSSKGYGYCALSRERSRLYHYAFHHVDPSLKEEEVSRLVGIPFSTAATQKDRIVKELTNCVLLSVSSHLSVHGPDLANTTVTYDGVFDEEKYTSNLALVDSLFKIYISDEEAAELLRKFNTFWESLTDEEALERSRQYHSTSCVSKDFGVSAQIVQDYFLKRSLIPCWYRHDDLDATLSFFKLDRDLFFKEYPEHGHTNLASRYGVRTSAVTGLLAKHGIQVDRFSKVKPTHIKQQIKKRTS